MPNFDDPNLIWVPFNRLAHGVLIGDWSEPVRFKLLPNDDGVTAEMWFQKVEAPVATTE